MRASGCGFFMYETLKKTELTGCPLFFFITFNEEYSLIKAHNFQKE